MSVSRQRVFTMSLMVTGNLLGAGILALPINLGPAGMIPASFGVILTWALMLYSSFVLADQKHLTSGETGGLPSFFGKELGPLAKWLAVAADLVILYGVLTAYLSGTSSILINLFNLPLSQAQVCTAYFIVAVTLTSFGLMLLRRCNAVIMIIMGVCFLALIAMTIGHVRPEQALPMQWDFLPAAMPVILTAFLYHNLIPTVCRQLDNDRKAIRRAMFIGSTIGLVMNLLWTVVVFCSLPLFEPKDMSIATAFTNNLPATVPLSRMLDSELFTNIGLVFAILSMTAAFMANGVALRDFMRDLAHNSFHVKNELIIWAACFMPPFLVAVTYPNIFLTAMNLVGGGGVAVIFGVLPGVLLLRQGRDDRRPFLAGLVMIVLFGLILAFELGQEFGLTHIKPNVEYWTHILHYK